MSHEQNAPKDPLDVAIASLRNKRDQIDAAIAAIEAIRSGGAIGAPTTSSAPIVAKEMEDKLLEDAVKALDATGTRAENVTQA